jgi:hypothetical protein
MFRFTTVRRIVLTALILVAATPVFAGPPWISIELPGNPYDAAARDAFLIVHAFHHGTPVEYPVAGTAEGVVNGRRTTIPLSFEKTSRAGAFAVRKQWTDGSPWVLAFTVTQARDDVASAILSIGADGRVSRVETLTRREGDGRVYPRAVVRADVEAALVAVTGTK